MGVGSVGKDRLVMDRDRGRDSDVEEEDEVVGQREIVHVTARRKRNAFTAPPTVDGIKQAKPLRKNTERWKSVPQRQFNRKCSFQQHKCSRRKCSPSYHIQEPFRRALFLEVSKRCMRVKEREWQSLCILCLQDRTYC